MEKIKIVLDFLFMTVLILTLVLTILFVFWLILNVISEIRDFFKEKKEEKKSLEFTFSTDKMILEQMRLEEVDSFDPQEMMKISQDKSPSLNVGVFLVRKKIKKAPAESGRSEMIGTYIITNIKWIIQVNIVKNNSRRSEWKKKFILLF